MWMSAKCRRVRTVLVWTHLAVFCVLVRKDPNLTSLVLVARVSLYWLLHWAKGAGPFGWNHLLFQFKDCHFLSHHHDVNFELAYTLKSWTLFHLFSCSDTFCMFFLPKGIAFTRKTTAVDNRCGAFLGGWWETLIRRPRANSYVCHVSFFVWLKKCDNCMRKT